MTNDGSGAVAGSSPTGRRMSSDERLERMRKIRSRDTKPEMIVRRLVHAMGYRYVLHSKKHPGHPDLAFPRLLKAIEVHGCLWHAHEGCPMFRPPKSNQEYWGPKLARNKQRDARNRADLEVAGWELLVVWECELSDRDRLRKELRAFLTGTMMTH